MPTYKSRMPTFKNKMPAYMSTMPTHKSKMSTYKCFLGPRAAQVGTQTSDMEGPWPHQHGGGEW